MGFASGSVYVTEEGIEKINAELDLLKNEKRIALSDRLHAAISMGDLSENADYAAAKQEQGFLEGRIKDLEDVLRRAEVIKHDGRNDRVRVGNTVTISEEGVDDLEKFKIVGRHEANPELGLISNESPIGSSLLGARVGQLVKADVPAGQLTFLIRDIS